MAYTTIDDPSVYFQTKLYTGTGSSQAYTNDGNSNLQPDWLWIKIRSSADSHHLFDSTRGVTKRLHTDSSSAEVTISDGSNLTDFGSNGFTLGGNGGVNGSSSTYVAWQWKANGGTTSSNSDGGITSTVQANTTAGFSIVTYTGTGSATTVGHGLGATPKLVIVKERANTNSWLVQSNLFSSSNFVTFLNRSDTGGENDSTTFNGTFPTSSVFSVGTHTGTNRSSGTYVAYCFANIKGYSKIGSYTGNGNADGTFVYTGFKPAFILIKGTNVAQGWWMFDNKRVGYNVDNNLIQAENSAAENTSDWIDILSNGFKPRSSDNGLNGSYNYIYMAFAENPFVSSKGVPTTAR
tara:strand:- start:180 stop:1229 length:1050 start_codon:yes stop_codon:yes gene_type:complete